MINAHTDIFDRPVFIVAAPRSGSTLLFETLARNGEIWTVGGEAHAVFEGIPALQVGAPGIDSNRLTASSARGETGDVLRNRLLVKLRDRDGNPLPVNPSADIRVRLLEKTPKNSLRIPFINAVFPDALFIYLYRDPRDNISSIMEAWRSGGWVTYRNLPGWEGSWSLLLPPGWIRMHGKSLGEVAAFQWQSANHFIQEDLETISSRRWTTINYADLVDNPGEEVERLCAFAGVPFDRRLADLTSGPLPLSRYTLTPPTPEKWRKNAVALARVLPAMEETVTQYERLSVASTGKSSGQ